MHSRSLFAAASILVLGVTMSLGACSSSSSADDTAAAAGSGGAAATSLYDKYGGAATVSKVVDDAVTGLLADPDEAPFFTSTLGMPGHDTADHLKSCLRLQFTVVLGGPGSYPGNGDDGMACKDMMTAHAGLGISDTVFQKFIMDLGSVLAADSVSSDDVKTLAGELETLESQIVTDGAGGSGGAGGAGGAGDAGGSAGASDAGGAGGAG